MLPTPAPGAKELLSGRLDLLQKLYGRIVVPEAVVEGVLLKAKQEGHIAAVAPLLNNLSQQIDRAASGAGRETQEEESRVPSKSD